MKLLFRDTHAVSRYKGKVLDPTKQVEYIQIRLKLFLASETRKTIGNAQSESHKFVIVHRVFSHVKHRASVKC